MLATPGLWPIILGLMFTFGFLFLVASVRNENTGRMRILGAVLIAVPLAAVSDLAGAVLWVRHTGRSRLMLSRAELFAILAATTLVWFLVVNALASLLHNVAHRKNDELTAAPAKQ